MSSNNNGFADALKSTNTLLKVNKKVQMSVLEEAAEYFAQKLKPAIPIDSRTSLNMRDHLEVVEKNGEIQVRFDDKAFYWRFVEHGHKKAGGRGRVKGQHFVQNTFDREAERISEIMTSKIIQKMEG